jgi:hypothetical protein
MVLREPAAISQAEEREREESKRLRDLKRSEMGELRRSELLLRDQLATSMEEKRLHLAHLTWLEHQARLTAFLVTTASAPPLHFLPATLCDATREALANRRAASASEVERAEARLAEALGRVKAEAAQREAELNDKCAAPRRGGDAAGGDAAGGDEAPNAARELSPAAELAKMDDDPGDEELDAAAAATPAGLVGVLGSANA